MCTIAKNGNTYTVKGCILFCLPPPPGVGQRYDQIICWGKNYLKGTKKGHAPPTYNEFHLGKNMTQERGRGKNMHFKFNIHP